MVDADKRQVKLALHDMGEEIFDLLLDYREAVEMISGKTREESSSAILRTIKQEILDKGEPFEIAHLAANGNDLLEAQLAEGSGIGEMLQVLLSAVIEDPSKNEKETLLLLAGQQKRSKE